MRLPAAILLTVLAPAAAAQTTLEAQPAAPSPTRNVPAPVSTLTAAPAPASRVTITSMPRSTIKIVPLAAGDLAGGAATTSVQRAVSAARSEIVIAALPRSKVRIEALGGTETLAVATLKSELGARETERGTLISLPGDVLFDFDRYAIRRDAQPTLAKLAELIERSPDRRVLIEGHTDAKGSDAYNLRLSEQRARAVAEWLSTRHGLDPGLFEERGLGESQPAAPNTHPDGRDNPEGRQLNRRVEVILTR